MATRKEIAERVQEVIRLSQTHTVREISVKLNCSRKSVNGVLHRNGLKQPQEVKERARKDASALMSIAKRKRNTEDKDFQKIKAIYPRYTNTEIADLFPHIAPNRLNGILVSLRRIYGLSKTDEAKERAVLQRRCMAAANITSENARKGRARKIARDRRRMLEGKKPLVFKALRAEGMRCRNIMALLVQRYGFFLSDTPYVLLYDETTKLPPAVRSPKSRRKPLDYYTQKYGIRFVADYQNTPQQETA